MRVFSTLGRREAAGWFALALAQVATPPAAHAAIERRCSTTSNPSVTITTCEPPPLTATGSLGGCGAGESCIATSAIKSPSKYSPPWKPPVSSPESADPRRTFRALIGALEEQAGLMIAVRDDQRMYVRATATSKVPPDGADDVEFVVRPASGQEGVTVSFRSATRQSVMVYPITQPLIDQDTHYKRLREIRRRLGWDEAGGLPSDAELEQGEGMRQVRNILGLNFGGMRVPDDEDEY